MCVWGLNCSQRKLESEKGGRCVQSCRSVYHPKLSFLAPIAQWYMETPIFTYQFFKPYMDRHVRSTEGGRGPQRRVFVAGVEEGGFNPRINPPIHQWALKGHGFNRANNPRIKIRKSINAAKPRSNLYSTPHLHKSCHPERSAAKSKDLRLLFVSLKTMPPSQRYK